MKKTINILIIFAVTLILCGCKNTKYDDEIKNQQNKNTECDYQYNYSCGLDIISGQYKCGYGMFYICN